MAATFFGATRKIPFVSSVRSEDLSRRVVATTTTMMKQAGPVRAQNAYVQCDGVGHMAPTCDRNQISGA
jgi:hypothetical protein